MQKEPEHQRNFPNPGYGEAMPTSYQPPQNYGGPPPGRGPYDGYGGGPPPYGGQQVGLARLIASRRWQSTPFAFRELVSIVSAQYQKANAAAPCTWVRVGSCCVSVLTRSVCRADGKVGLPLVTGGRHRHLATGEDRRRTMAVAMGRLPGSMGRRLGSGEDRHLKVCPAEARETLGSPDVNGFPLPDFTARVWATIFIAHAAHW